MPKYPFLVLGSKSDYKKVKKKKKKRDKREYQRDKREAVERRDGILKLSID